MWAGWAFAKGLFMYYVTQCRWVGGLQNVTLFTYAIGEILLCQGVTRDRWVVKLSEKPRYIICE